MTDLEYADEILALHKVLQTTADGEWKWIHENRKQHYLTALREHDRETLARILSNLFREDASYGIFNDFDTLESSLLTDLETWRTLTNQADLSLLSMPDIGNPRGVTVDGIFVAPDQPRHDYFALKIKSLNPTTVLEIGGGYGGLALQLSRRATVKYIDCDLPETLYLSYYFLSKSGLDVKWAVNGVPDAAVVLVPADRREMIRGQVDLVFNSNSLSEMALSTVADYMNLINNVWQPHYFLHQNSNFLLFPDSSRHIEVLASEFQIDRKYREVYMSVSPWQGGGGRYREFLYQR